MGLGSLWSSWSSGPSPPSLRCPLLGRWGTRTPPLPRASLRQLWAQHGPRQQGCPVPDKDVHSGPGPAAREVRGWNPTAGARPAHSRPCRCRGHWVCSKRTGIGSPCGKMCASAPATPSQRGRAWCQPPPPAQPTRGHDLLPQAWHQPPSPARPAGGHDLLPQPDHTQSHLSACLGLALCFLQEVAPGLWGALRRLWAWRTGAPAVTSSTRGPLPRGPCVWAMTQ